ncbi:uncharacterized protein LOC142610482 [Castanea sativa]|uniref:uncharacterized protein LOC142610482 n=1 Tax=Castanea sativa TaxID=21020 RepID=UPI003F64B7F1
MYQNERPRKSNHRPDSKQTAELERQITISSRGEYQVKQGYKMLAVINQENANRNDHPSKKCWLNLWKLGIPSRVSTFMWKILHRGLPTRTELFKKQIIMDESFVFARVVWFGAAQGLRTHLTNTTDLVSRLESQIVNCDIKNYEELEILIEQGAILWTIWKTRNRAIFENQEPNIHQAVHSVQRLKYEWMQATIAQEQRHFTPLEERHYKSFSNCMEWQTLIIIGNINHCGKVNRDGGAFVIKDRLGQSVKKGCFSWYVRNKKTSNLLTIREALYTTWKEGYRKAILLVSSVKLAKEVETTNTNNKEAEILLEDIRIQKRIFQSLYIKVAPAPIFQEVQQLAKMAT